jgi:hypothetical protein
MGSAYQLRINTDEMKYELLNKQLNLLPTSDVGGWEFSIEESSALFNTSIDYLLSLLEQKIDVLRIIGISNEDISLWYLYEYDQQCNIEFDSIALKRMGNLGITLCISCWQKG